MKDQGRSDRDPIEPPIDISFVVAAHNVAPFIAEAVRSGLAQRDCRIEVIVVDDASSDDTAAIVEDLCRHDSRVRLVRRPRSGGAAAARNDGFALAAGEWIAVLDGDDIVMPGRGRAMLDAARASSADIVADNVERFGKTLSRETTIMAMGTLPYGVMIDVASYLGANLILRRGVNLGFLKPMFRRSFLVRHGLRYDERLRIAEDSHLCLEALLADARYLVLSEPFYRYRVRSGSLSWRLERRDVDAMAAAFAPLRPSLEAAGGATASASRRFVLALERARAILTVVDAAKAGLLGSALYTAWRRPDTWSFLGAVAFGVLRRAASQSGRRLWSASA